MTPDSPSAAASAAVTAIVAPSLGLLRARLPGWSAWAGFAAGVLAGIATAAQQISFLLPLGILAHAVPRLRAGVLGALDVVQTIPSLALFVVLPLIIPTRILDEAKATAQAVYGSPLVGKASIDAAASAVQSAIDAAQTHVLTDLKIAQAGANVPLTLT